MGWGLPSSRGCLSKTRVSWSPKGQAGQRELPRTGDQPARRTGQCGLPWLPGGGGSTLMVGGNVSCRRVGQSGLRGSGWTLTPRCASGSAPRGPSIVVHGCGMTGHRAPQAPSGGRSGGRAARLPPASHCEGRCARRGGRGAQERQLRPLLLLLPAPCRALRPRGWATGAAWRPLL